MSPVTAPSGYLGGYLGMNTTTIPDGNPPIITIVSPAPGVSPGDPGGFPLDWAAARMTPVVVRITDIDPGRHYECVVARYAGRPDELVVYRRGAFRGLFTGSGQATITNGIELTILPVGGWFSSDVLDDLVLELDAVDSAGNLNA